MEGRGGLGCVEQVQGWMYFRPEAEEGIHIFLEWAF